MIIDEITVTVPAARMAPPEPPLPPVPPVADTPDEEPPVPPFPAEQPVMAEEVIVTGPAERMAPPSPPVPPVPAVVSEAVEPVPAAPSAACPLWRVRLSMVREEASVTLKILLLHVALMIVSSGPVTVRRPERETFPGDRDLVLKVNTRGKDNNIIIVREGDVVPDRGRGTVVDGYISGTCREYEQQHCKEQHYGICQTVPFRHRNYKICNYTSN